MANSLTKFKSILAGGGARPNLFEVTISDFPGYTDAVGEDIKFLCKGAQLPESTVGLVEVPFRGSPFKVAGARTLAPWSITVINDTDFNIRNAIERWMNAINDTVTNTGLSNVADYTADLTVEQLDRDDTVLKSYILRNCQPTGTGAIELSYDTANAIEEFTVTWRYSHFEASSVNFYKRTK